MTNREKYKQAFSAIHAPDNFSLEGNKMSKTSRPHKIRAMVAAVAACIIIAGGATTAYAADVGGIQRTLQLWMYGDQTEVTIRFDGSGSYAMDYIDSEGNAAHQGGGGVSIEDDGTEIPLSEAELMELLMDPNVRYEEDGSVFVYWFDQKIDITDKFENGICYVKLENGAKTLYMTVKYQDGLATSPSKYPAPSTFN